MYIPADLDFPQPHVLGKLSGQHGISSGPIVVVDAQTILVPDFSYDGQAPGTAVNWLNCKFFLVRIFL